MRNIRSIKPLLFFAVTLMLLISASMCFAAQHKSVFIPVEELHQLLEKDATSQPILLEVAWGGPENIYNKGHIPGAIHINTDEIEYDVFKPRTTTAPADLGRSTSADQDQAKGLGQNATLPQNWWNIYPDKYLLPALANMGINLQSSVVLYDNDALAASRLAWTLLYAGVENVRLLNGGLRAWKKAGYDVITEPRYPTSVQAFGTVNALHPEYLVDIAFVREAINTNNKDFILGDIRGEKEYTGESAPYPYIPTRGRIKGALWGKAGTTPWDMANYVNQDGTYKEPKIIEKMWAKNGITGDKHVAFYCGTAWRSSLAFLYAYELGWQRVSNFDSSWYEWSMGPEKAKNPVE